MTSIAITQLGLCSPLGNDHQQVLARLTQADTSAMVWREDLIPEQATLVGQVQQTLPPLPESLSLFDCRNNRLLLAAALQISDAVNQAKQQYGTDRIGVVLGTSTSGISHGEYALQYKKQHGEMPASYHYTQQELGNGSQFIQAYFGLNGPNYTISTACSSSAKVFASAKRLLQADLCDMVIVGGADSLCKLTLNGFNSLESVSATQCKPFSPERDGINIGEAAALFTLERASTPAKVMLAGIGESSDAHHISAPHPDGLGAIKAMQQALVDADIQAQAIDYINLHGTATMQNDAMESRAINTVFEQIPACSSTKPLTGHTLGAAGALEAAFCYLLLTQSEQNLLPPQAGNEIYDPRNPVIPLVRQGQSQPLNYVMSNSFAFGGSNASLIFCRGASQ